ncbi:MAG: FAD-dependent thymidylate synthase [Candidatus Berkelbacteria bacterium]|nr:FAD-dependent thymidylate synthase [Candidatus Berkelbacteria bacterium]
MQEAKLTVKLLSYTSDPERTVVAAIRQCYSSLSGKDLWEKVTEDQKERLIRQIISSGHTSTLEHASFTFSIEGVSRALTHQLVRHRIASYSQKSQRYVKEGGFEYILPPTIKKDEKASQIYLAQLSKIQEDYNKLLETGIPAEDARMLLPNACETKIVVTMNVRSLFNFFEERLCNRAQWEIRKMAGVMYKEVSKVAPNIFKYAGPTCVTEKICWQGKLHCGKPDKDKSIELRERGAGL